MLLNSDNLKSGMRETLYASMNEEMKVALLREDYHIPVKVLEQFKISIEQLHELAGKIPYARSVADLLKANKESLTEEMVVKFLQPLPDYFRRVANRQITILASDGEPYRSVRALYTPSITLAILPMSSVSMVSPDW